MDKSSRKQQAPHTPPEQEKTPLTGQGEGGRVQTTEAPYTTATRTERTANGRDFTFEADPTYRALRVIERPSTIAYHLRRVGGYSQADLAHTFFGKTRSVVTHYENGRRSVPVAYLAGAIRASTAGALPGFESAAPEAVRAGNVSPWQRWAEKLGRRGIGDVADCVRRYGADTTAAAILDRDTFRARWVGSGSQPGAWSLLDFAAQVVLRRSQQLERQDRARGQLTAGGGK